MVRSWEDRSDAAIVLRAPLRLPSRQSCGVIFLVRALSLGSCLRCAWMCAAWSAAPLDPNSYLWIDPSTRLVWSLLGSLPVPVVSVHPARPAPSPRSPLATARRRALVVKSCRAARYELLCLNCFKLGRRRRPRRLLRAHPCSRRFAFFPTLLVWWNTSPALDLAALRSVIVRSAFGHVPSSTSKNKPCGA